MLCVLSLQQSALYFNTRNKSFSWVVCLTRWRWATPSEGILGFTDSAALWSRHFGRGRLFCVFLSFYSSPLLTRVNRGKKQTGFFSECKQCVKKKKGIHLKDSSINMAGRSAHRVDRWLEGADSWCCNFFLNLWLRRSFKLLLMAVL